MLKKIKALENITKKLRRRGYVAAKRKLLPLKRDLAYVIDFARNPVKFDFECTFEEDDVP